jgi:hypothetical protein
VPHGLCPDGIRWRQAHDLGQGLQNGRLQILRTFLRAGGATGIHQPDDRDADIRACHLHELPLMDFLRIFFKTALDNRAVLLYEEALKLDNRKHALEPEQM